MEIIEKKHSKAIVAELEWFECIINTSLTLYFNNESEYQSIEEIKPPEFKDTKDAYAKFVSSHKLSLEERIVLMLSMSVYLKPQSLDVFLIKNQNLGAVFTEFGGVVESKRHGFIPTLETAAFILGGTSMERRFHFLNSFGNDHFFFTKGILEIDINADFILHQKLYPTIQTISLFTTGKEYLPQYGAKFPAKENQDRTFVGRFDSRQKSTI